MSERARLLAAHVRTLADDDVGDLLVELPRERFAGLCQVALAQPLVPDALALSFQQAASRQGEVTRWDVLVARPLRNSGGDRMVGGVIGAVARCTWPTSRGGEAAGWAAFARPGEQATGEQPVQAGVCWPTRTQAAAALAWVTPASGARALTLAAHVRALSDDELGDVLVELPTRRFVALLDAAFPDPTEQGVAA
jgi:hypothetical protein